jgi:3-hydroxyacyl-[acyl-carrier-protein] dehydratase
MAQAGAVILLNMDEYKGKLAFFTGADNVKWRKQVKPGDTLTLTVKLEKIKLGMGVAIYYNRKITLDKCRTK